jgi:hypothetical protein
MWESNFCALRSCPEAGSNPAAASIRPTAPLKETGANFVVRSLREALDLVCRQIVPASRHRIGKAKRWKLLRLDLTYRPAVARVWLIDSYIFAAA